MEITRRQHMAVALAKEIEAKYPLDPEWAPKTKTSAPDTAETNNSPSLQTIS